LLDLAVAPSLFIPVPSKPASLIVDTSLVLPQCVLKSLDLGSTQAYKGFELDIDIP